MRDVSDAVLWGLILPYVRRPTPTALSSPPRSDLRQQTLTVCMRISKLFESICEPLLYGVIATDVLPKILFRSDSTSMRRRLGHTRRLLIEYLPKPYHPSYCEIMDAPNNATWRWLSGIEPDTEENALEYCDIEKEGLLRCLKMAMNAAWEGTPVFLRLESVAISSIYGNAGGHWRRFMRWESDQEGEPGQPVLGPADVFGAFLSTYNIRHLCTRDPYSPLNLHPVSWASDRRSPSIDYTITQHFDPAVDFLFLPLGNTIRWVSEASQTADLAPIIRKVRYVVDQLQKVRDLTPDPFSRKTWPDVANVQIYCTTAICSKVEDAIPLGVNPPGPMSIADQEVLAEVLTKYFAQDFRENSGLDDTVEWHTSDKTPTCEACFSGVPV